MAPIMLVVDISNLVARAYHSVPEQQRNFGLCRHRLVTMTKTMLREVEPDRLIGCADSGTTFRHELYPEYKAHRGEKDELHAQLRREAPAILSQEFGMECYKAEGFEADDAIASIAARSMDGWRVIVCSNDLDLAALAYRGKDGTGVYLLRYDSGAYHVFGPEQVQEKLKMGVPPHQVSIFKALQGDPGDNVPGASGIGPVAARRLAKWGSVRRIWNNLEQLQKSDRTKLQAAGLEHLELMERLTALRHDAVLTRI